MFLLVCLFVSVMVVINECEASGSYCAYILSTTVLKDVFVVVLFVINVEFVVFLGLDFYNIILDVVMMVLGGEIVSNMMCDVGASAAARRFLVNLKFAT